MESQKQKLTRAVIKRILSEREDIMNLTYYGRKIKVKKPKTPINLDTEIIGLLELASVARNTSSQAFAEVAILEKIQRELFEEKRVDEI